MATAPRPRPRTRVEELRERHVDRSVRGSAEDRKNHQLRTLKEWRPIREKVAGK